MPLLVVLILASSLQAQEQTGESPKSPQVSAPQQGNLPEISTEELAAKVYKSIVDKKNVHFKAEVQGRRSCPNPPLDVVQLDVWMSKTPDGKGMLRTEAFCEVFEEKIKFYELICDGVTVTERLLDEHVTYPQPINDGLENTRIIHGKLACVTGDLIFSWFAWDEYEEEYYQAAYFRDKIKEGELSRKEFEGRLCYFTSWQRRKMLHEFYIDPETFWPVRYALTIFQVEPPSKVVTILRDLDFSEIPDDVFKSKPKAPTPSSAKK